MTNRMHLNGIGATLVAVLAAGCTSTSPPATSVATPPSHAPSQTPAPSVATAEPEPVPQAPAWIPFGEPLVPDVGTAAVIERSDIRFTLSVETNPLLGTVDSWILTALENAGSKPMYWVADGCKFHAGVTAVTATAWHAGAAQTGAAAVFKAAALAGIDSPVRFVVTPETLLPGGPGCGDIGIVHSLRPGERIVQRTRWQGESQRGYGAGPDAPVLLGVDFAPLGWHREGEPHWSREGFRVQLVVGVNGGRDPAFLSPGQAIDAALGDDRFRAFLEAETEAGFEEIILTADSDSAIWRVGVETTDGSGIVVLVDGLLATVIGIETP